MFPDSIESRDRQIINKIRTLLVNDRQFGAVAGRVKVTVENADVVLRGQLDSPTLKEQLVSLVRRAGVLCRVRNQVEVR